jgi:arginine decarboxylase
MGTPLYDALRAYIARDTARFHMPGHKGAPIEPFGAVTAYDLTEVPGTDSLYEASGPIREAERRLSALYGTADTLLSAGGSTLCIQAMLALVAREGGKVIAGRNLHIAAVNAMALLGLEPYWIYPDGSSGEGIGGRISPDAVVQALNDCPDAAAVYVTSPDYFGVCSDIAGLAAVCHARGVPLLVDNAHGAHLRFLPEPIHPIGLGADLCCDSLHKTLPALTGAALLQVGNPAYVPAARAKLALFGSTSPSYLIMLSIDRCIEYMETAASADLHRTILRVQELADLARRQGLRLPQGLCDPTRLSLLFGGTDLTAARCGEVLRDQGCEPELLCGAGCVLLLSAFNRPGDFARLRRALEGLCCRPQPNAPADPLPRPQRAVSLRQAVLGESERLPVEKTIGRISAQSGSVCPPGIPLVVAGERIDKNVLKALKNYGIDSLLVLK